MALRFQAVLFDHDGTLVDSEATHNLHWNQVLQPYGVALNAAQYMADFAGMPTLANAEALRRSYQVRQPAHTLADAKNQLTEAYLRTHAYPLMPGVREALAQIDIAGLRKAVVTGARSYAIDATLRSHHLAAHFETVVSADDVVHSKPAPDCYLLALQRMGLQAHQVVALEDTEHGVAAAVAAGIACVAIPTPMSSQHNFSAATVVLPTMQAAVDWVLGQG